VPITSLLAGDGAILWPSATPNDASVAAARKAAESAVRTVFEEHAKSGHASVRHVVEAKNKLVDFKRPALRELRVKNAADAAGLEKFVYELGKTLETMAVNY
jgi:hypothetical protein